MRGRGESGSEGGESPWETEGQATEPEPSALGAALRPARASLPQAATRLARAAHRAAPGDPARSRRHARSAS